ncbi:hypothetical protein B0T17DRAFT_506728 [Bombardia bombarda]|uniref:Uncharacterized protein n=1 Tax=Bombardia bombarda TaxID=252184 RepID=A0AA39XAB3_9PEZI|nr:hypothetical protein B0T17DRAFT_506728 [Bombardia bombarda]
MVWLLVVPSYVGKERIWISGTYDLVVLSESPSEDVINFLKPGGFVVANNLKFVNASSYFKPVFTHSNFKCWQLTENIVTKTAPLTILIATKTSALTKSIVASIKKSYPGHVETGTFPTSPRPTTPDVISLVSLDENFFFFQSQDVESACFKALQKLLSGNVPSIT